MATATTNVKFKIRRDTQDGWASKNPVLALGEPGYETTNSILKIGDGTTTWNDLIPVNFTLNIPGPQGPVGTATTLIPG